MQNYSKNSLQHFRSHKPPTQSPFKMWENLSWPPKHKFHTVLLNKYFIIKIYSISFTFKITEFMAVSFQLYAHLKIYTGFCFIFTLYIWWKAAFPRYQENKQSLIIISICKCTYSFTFLYTRRHLQKFMKRMHTCREGLN